MLWTYILLCAYTREISKWWFSKGISLQIWQFWLSMLNFRGYQFECNMLRLNFLDLAPWNLLWWCRLMVTAMILQEVWSWVIVTLPLTTGTLWPQSFTSLRLNKKLGILNPDFYSPSCYIPSIMICCKIQISTGFDYISHGYLQASLFHRLS